jgi:hypothetical protein
MSHGKLFSLASGATVFLCFKHLACALYAKKFTANHLGKRFGIALIFIRLFDS